jgi:hypothetical protein
MEEEEEEIFTVSASLKWSLSHSVLNKGMHQLEVACP